MNDESYISTIVMSLSVFQVYQLVLTSLNMNNGMYNRIHKISMM